MSNDKSNRKKPAKAIIAVIILVIASIFGINVADIIPTGSNISSLPATIFEQKNDTQSESGVQEASGELFLTMIDVGQADSFLLVQDETVALVDCGTRSTGKDVVEYLKGLGINKIDYVFGTHPHDDHMGGMYDIITNFEIGKIILPKVESGKVTSNWYIKLMQEIKTGDYELEYAKVGTTYGLGEAIIKVIGPISSPEDNLNNYSIVLKVSFGEMDVIMTGDAETEVEKEILESGENIDAEILKVGHHGSNTSSSEEFIDAISPDYALISAKVGNKYEHPMESTMNKLESRYIEVYRTDENGTVVATITSNDVSFSCEPGDYLSGKDLEKREAK